MDLTKKVDLFYGKVELKPADRDVQAELDQEKEFCAVYVENDAPNDVHYKTSAHLMKMFGADSKLAQEKGSSIRPFYVVERDGEEVVVMKRGLMKVEKPKRPTPVSRDLMDAMMIYRSFAAGGMKLQLVDGEWKQPKGDIFDELNTFKAKGLFFNENMADAVISELGKMGYEVVKKYK